MTTIIYQPAQCLTCRHLLVRNCCALPFSTMPVIRVEGHIAMVECTGYVGGAKR